MKWCVGLIIIALVAVIIAIKWDSQPSEGDASAYINVMTALEGNVNKLSLSIEDMREPFPVTHTGGFVQEISRNEVLNHIISFYRDKKGVTLVFSSNPSEEGVHRYYIIIRRDATCAPIFIKWDSSPKILLNDALLLKPMALKVGIHGFEQRDVEGKIIVKYIYVNSDELSMQ